MTGVVMIGVLISGVRMMGVVIMGVLMTGVVMTGVVIGGVVMAGVIKGGVVITGVVIGGVLMTGVVMTGVLMISTGSDVNGACEKLVRQPRNMTTAEAMMVTARHRRPAARGWTDSFALMPQSTTTPGAFSWGETRSIIAR